MFYVDTPCPICRAGAVGFRKCADGTTIVLMCNECDAVWKTPDGIAVDSALFPAAPNFVVQELDCSVAAPRATWAERQQIEASGWGEFVAGEGGE